MSFTPSKVISSSQPVVHKNLKKVVDKHLATQFRKPVADYSQLAFEQFYNRWISLGRPNIVLDSACGTAESTRYFSQEYQDCLVVGLDQSAKRLANSENADLADNCLLLRCECTDFWRLLEQAKLTVEKHYLLYPNPWPKPQHLQRRWHGHPAFPSLLAISSKIDLRTNWQTYAEEFNTALAIANYSAQLVEYQSEQAITAFERKYLLSGHQLWQVCS